MTLGWFHYFELARASVPTAIWPRTEREHYLGGKVNLVPEPSEKDRALRRRATNTIGDLLGDPRQSLHAFCERCQHSGKLDLRMLAERYGRDLTIDALVRKLRCMSCPKDQSGTTRRKVVVRRVYDPSARLPSEDDGPWLR